MHIQEKVSDREMRSSVDDFDLFCDFKTGSVSLRFLCGNPDEIFDWLRSLLEEKLDGNDTNKLDDEIWQ